MLYSLKVIYQTFFVPPGIFLILFLSIVFWLYRRRQKKTATLLLAVTTAFYLCCIHFISDPLIRSLESYHTPPATVNGDVILLLGGGATMDTPNLSGQGHLSSHAANRLLTAAQLYNKYKLPILVSGGKVLASTGTEAEIARLILLDLGIPDTDIIVESQSLNTTQNAQFSKKIMEQHNMSHPILVTSAFHMPRSVLQFEKVGVTVTAYPADYQTNVQQTLTVFDFVPSGSALESLSLSVKEYIGLAAVKWY